jgi:hypothetical protein
MRNLWRALALAWLGGIASPALTDEPLLPDAVVADEAPDPAGVPDDADEPAAPPAEAG